MLYSIDKFSSKHSSRYFISSYSDKVLHLATEIVIIYNELSDFYCFTGIFHLSYLWSLQYRGRLVYLYSHNTIITYRRWGIWRNIIRFAILSLRGIFTQGKYYHLYRVTFRGIPHVSGGSTNDHVIHRKWKASKLKI
jgi:hypothetical protein